MDIADKGIRVMIARSTGTRVLPQDIEGTVLEVKADVTIPKNVTDTRLLELITCDVGFEVAVKVRWDNDIRRIYGNTGDLFVIRSFGRCSRYNNLWGNNVVIPEDHRPVSFLRPHTNFIHRHKRPRFGRFKPKHMYRNITTYEELDTVTDWHEELATAYYKSAGLSEYVTDPVYISYSSKPIEVVQRVEERKPITARNFMVFTE